MIRQATRSQALLHGDKIRTCYPEGVLLAVFLQLPEGSHGGIQLRLRRVCHQRAARQLRPQGQRRRMPGA